jgi:hypothetical protein
VQKAEKSAEENSNAVEQEENGEGEVGEGGHALGGGADAQAGVRLSKRAEKRAEREDCKKTRKK